MSGGEAAEPDVEQISPVAQDYLKAIWSATEWGDPPITATALARRFGTSAANVTETVKRLVNLGLVEYERYRPVSLTPAGNRYAVEMVRRHRLLETFLVQTLGYSWNEVHHDAERLEHAATPLLIDRIDALLGHPTTDPHGDPIPDPDGRLRRPGEATRLALAGPGDWTVLRVSDADPSVLTLAERRGILPGSSVTVERTADWDTALGAAVWVTPAS